MDSKVVNLELIPGHPKFIRLPSLSRSLVHSIMPKACHEMHIRPSVFTISTKPIIPEGPPVLSTPKNHKKKSYFSTIERPLNIRPSTTSYTYKKVYQTKIESQRLKRQYYSPKNIHVEKKVSPKMYYCEVVLPEPRKISVKKHRPLYNTTKITFGNNPEPEDNLDHISEVHSSMESSEFTTGSLNYLKNEDY
ncbi:hypothetical protein SteCoe_20333 [Stentor coeruleus]|uniref:Uncharacterized protein n=1 Tax=Stentor coeruleus TaxID=5963 RepID=A0A1R2BS14_9CILI|nr:hypothetical protein SteCoe_20333 [Stentor coeruleus]